MRPLTAEEQSLFEKGKTQYATLCAACHQPTGQGLAGLAPSLVYSRWVLGDPRVLARIVLNDTRLFVVLTLVLLLAILWIDLRSLSQAVVAMLPLLAGTPE